MGYAPSKILADRHRRLRQALVACKLDALVVSWLPNVFYLTNFAGSSAIVLLTAETLYFITDFRYITAVETSWATPYGCPGAKLVRVGTNYDETLINLVNGAGLTRIGFEARSIRYSTAGRTRKLPSRSPCSCAGGKSRARRSAYRPSR